jgi:hypothetical protein
MATSLKIDDTLKACVQHINIKQEALASWAAYQKTGRCLSAIIDIHANPSVNS